MMPSPYGYGLYGSTPAAGSTQSATEGVLADPAMEMVQKYLAQWEQAMASTAPAPLPQRGAAKEVLGTLGDALMAMATVRAGGTPPQMGAFAARKEAEQEEYRLAKQQYNERQMELAKEIQAIKLQIGLDAQKRVLDEQSEIAKEKRTDALIRARQKEDDERDAAIARADAERDAAVTLAADKRKRIFEIQNGLREAGVDRIIVPPKDPALMSWSEIVDFGNDAQSLLTGVEMTPEERIKHQIEEAAKADPRMKPTAIAYSGEDGKPNVRFAIDPLERFSEADKKLALMLGIPQWDEEGNVRSAKDIHEEITKAKKEDREFKIKERDARLAVIVNKAHRPTGTVGAKIEENLTMLQNAEVAMAVLSGMEGAPGGPVAGRLWPGMRYWMVDTFHGSVAGDKNRELSARIQNIFNVVAKIRSGAAVTLPEEIRLIPELPTMTDTKRTMISKLKLIIEFQRRKLENIQKTHGLQQGDIDYIAAELTDDIFIPVTPESGDIVIFDGDQ